MLEAKQPADAAPSEVQEIARDILAALRAVKLYPENNPVHSQTIARTFKVLNQYLDRQPEYHLGLQKAGFISRAGRITLGPHLSKGVAADLFAKGVREIAFTRGLTESELRDFLTVSAMQSDELKQQGGIAPILWGKGVVHVRIREAALDERPPLDGPAGTTPADEMTAGLAGELGALEGSLVSVFGLTIGLAELAADPASFGKQAVGISAGEGLSRQEQDDRLLEVYRQVGQQVLKKSYELRGPVFSALASSILSMDADQSSRLVAERLYPEADALLLNGNAQNLAERLPHDLHELISSRFSRSWTAPQVSSLLEKICSAEDGVKSTGPAGVPLPAGLAEAVRELAEYTPGELETLRTICESGEERDSLVAASGVLMHLLQSVQDGTRKESQQDSLSSFSNMVSQLEDAHDRLVAVNDYAAAGQILRAFRSASVPLYRQRLGEAIMRSAERRRIETLIARLRGLAPGAADAGVYLAYLSILDRQATPVLLEMLSAEEDRTMRRLLVQILKDLGRNQIAFLGQKLSDERWYFVRNIVSILGESHREEAVTYLAGVARHKNFQIRQEVVRALTTIGGGKAAELLVQFLADRDIDIRFMAIRGLGTLASPSARGEQALIDFLKRRAWSRKGDFELRLEAIGSLGRIGGTAAQTVLGKLARRTWWRSGRQNREISAEAARALAELERRTHGA